MKVFEQASDLIGNTPLVRLNGYQKEKKLDAELLAKLEYFNPAGSVKDRVALYMLLDAQEKGLLKRDSVIIEPTSGNTGIGLAAVAAEKGIRTIIVMPDTMSIERRNILKAYGAELVLTDGKLGMKGAIAKANELAEEIPHSFIPGQFTNDANPLAHYKTTGPEIWKDTDGDVDILVAGVGTGGTLSGAGRYLKEQNPDIQVVAVEPKDSPVLSEGRAGSHKLQGIGAGFVPRTLDIDIYDEVIPVTTQQALCSRGFGKASGKQRKADCDYYPGQRREILIRTGLWIVTICNWNEDKMSRIKEFRKMSIQEETVHTQNKIEVKDVCFDYVDKKSSFAALDHINLSIKEGEFICILGSSGCGKSTLLGLLNGLNKAKSGEILLDGKPIAGPGPDRAVVFQQYSLFPWLTAKGNILFGIKQSGKKYSKKEREEKAEEYLRSVGLAAARDKYPSQLSGGMKQRVAVARALALESDVLLLDEPFGAIDPKLRLELQELVSSLCTTHKKTVVFVTHDIDEAILLADRIVVMEPGKIRSILQVELPHPRKRDDLIGTQGYEKLHRKLIASFYEQVQDNIDAGVAL